MSGQAVDRQNDRDRGEEPTARPVSDARPADSHPTDSHVAGAGRNGVGDRAGRDGSAGRVARDRLPAERDRDRRYDRDAAERILQRALELDDDPLLAADHARFSASALQEAAEELGVPAQTVVQAAAEERLGVLDVRSRALDPIVGAGTLTVVRVVPGSVREVLDRSDAFLRSMAYRRRRSLDGSAEYVRRGDPVAAATRAVRSVGGRETLGPIPRVVVVAEQISPESTVVALRVDVETERSLTVAAGSTLAGGGTIVSVVEAASVTPWLWLGVPASAALGYGVLRMRLGQVRDRVSLLEGALDRIADPRDTPSSLADFRDRIRRQARGPHWA